jgi:lysophospholipase L1-like esterase
VTLDGFERGGTPVHYLRDMTSFVPLRFRAGITVVILMIVTTACGSTTAGTSSSVTTRPKAPAPAPLLYVSLGDSYAAGFQPTGPHSGHTDTNGFAYQVTGLAAKKGYNFKLVNFGCGGATTTSILYSIGCPRLALGPAATPYPTQSQATAAEAFLRSHRGKVGLITVSIGGNDVTACTAAKNTAACVVTAIKGINKNVAVLLKGLRAAAGPNVRIVGTTYPDVILGLYLSKTPTLRALAKLSVIAFKDLINPALKKLYVAVGGSFVDVTAATGAYGPLADTTVLPPYGKIPIPVAKVCQLTFFCEYQNIHPKTAGYKVIAELVVATLPEHHPAT